MAHSMKYMSKSVYFMVSHFEKSALVPMDKLSLSVRVKKMAFLGRTRSTVLDNPLHTSPMIQKM